jgi:hypothetical protein
MSLKATVKERLFSHGGTEGAEPNHLLVQKFKKEK